MWLVEKLEAIQVHSKLEFWRNEGPEKFERLRILHDHVLHGKKWIIYRGLLDIVVGFSKRGEYDVKLGALIIDWIVIGFEEYDIAMVGMRTWTYVAVPQHGPLSLYTKLKDPSIANLDFYFSW
jgi:hypothetical protein